jgi:hypothetical protein
MRYLLFLLLAVGLGFGQAIGNPNIVNSQGPYCQVYYDSFDSGTLDTVNRYKTPTTGNGGVAASNTVGSTILGTGTTANGFSQLEGQPNLIPYSPGTIFINYQISLPAVSTNADLFWGTGTSPGTPTIALPLTDAAGFELNNGKLFAVLWQGGAGQTFAQDLSAATGNNKQPTDGQSHGFGYYYRGDRLIWFIDDTTNVVAFTKNGAPGPNVNSLPLKMSAVGGATPPAANVQLVINAIWTADTACNGRQIASGDFPWRRAMVNSTGPTGTVGSLVVNHEGLKNSYRAAASFVPAGTSATDVFTITGTATKTVQVTHVAMNCTAGTATAVDMLLIKRSTADTAGTSTAVTAVPLDSNDAAATATVLAYTANPTLGNTVGNISALKELANITTGVTTGELLEEFGLRAGLQEVTLRGTSQVLAINLNSASITGSCDAEVEWTEQ